MVISSIIHINSLKSQNFNQNVGGAHTFLDEYFNDLNDIVCQTNLNSNNNNENDIKSLSSTQEKQPNKICDKTEHTRLGTNSHLIVNDVIVVESLVSNKNPNIKSKQESKMNERTKNLKKFRKKLHDPTINNEIFSCSTLKYALIALTSLVLLSAFIFIFLIGVVYLNSCGTDKNISIYLLVMGLAGVVQIFLHFSCPFDYSKSTLAKMYEHLIWRLIINRFKAAYYTSIQNSSQIYENSDQSFSDLSLTSKCTVKLSCCFDFVFNFFVAIFVVVIFVNNVF